MNDKINDKKKIKRKKKLIDKRFQLRIIFSVICISVISFSIIISFILLISTTSKSNVIFSTAKELDMAVESQDNIMKSFSEYSKRVKDPIFALATEKIVNDHKESIGIIKNNINILKVYSERNFHFLLLTIGIMIINSVFIFLYLIRKTSRASGPVYVMSKYVRDMLEGRSPEIRDLRKKDEFKEFYSDFVRLIEKFQKQKKKKNKKIKTKKKSKIKT